MWTHPVGLKDAELEPAEQLSASGRSDGTVWVAPTTLALCPTHRSTTGLPRPSFCNVCTVEGRRNGWPVAEAIPAETMLET